MEYDPKVTDALKDKITPYTKHAEVVNTDLHFYPFAHTRVSILDTFTLGFVNPRSFVPLLYGHFNLFLSASGLAGHQGPRASCYSYGQKFRGIYSCASEIVPWRFLC